MSAPIDGGEPNFMIRNCLYATLVFSLYLPVMSRAQAPAGSARTPAATPKPQIDNPIVARVNGSPITEEQVLNGINQYIQQQQLSPEQVKQKDTLFFKEVLDQQIGMYLLKDEAALQKITVDKVKVDEFLQKMIKNFPSEAEFKKVLELQGVTEASVRAAIADIVIGQQVLDANVKTIPAVSEADIKKYYDEHPQYFKRPESVRAAQIVLTPDPKSTPAEKADVRKKLETIRSDIESGKITFAEAAAKYSADKLTAAKGGDMGFFTRAQVVKPLEDAAFGTNPGKLSPVFETQFGYHLLSISEFKPAGLATLDESRDDIRKFLEGQARQAASREYINGLRARAKVEILMSSDEWDQRRGSKPH